MGGDGGEDRARRRETFLSTKGASTGVQGEGGRSGDGDVRVWKLRKFGGAQCAKLWV